MQCEIRKSCSLRNVVYEIGKLSSPVGIILVDTTDIKSTDLFKSPRDRFWSELKTVFRDVAQAFEYTLEEDIRRHLANSAIQSPVVIEISFDQIVSRGRLNGLLNRLQGLGIKRVAAVCITYGLNGAVYAEKMVSCMRLRDEPSHKRGVDMLIIVDDSDTVTMV